MEKTSRNPLLNILLLLATVPVAAWLSWKNRDYQLDDALIYLRYVRNVFEGSGLAYNPGDHFNGLTSPFYSYLLVVANSIAHNLQFTTIFLSFLFLCLAAIYGAAAVSDNRYEQALCGFFVVSFNYFYTTFGMETTLFLFLTALALYFYRKDNLFLVGITVGLVVLTRAEGVMLGVAILGHYILTKKRLPPIKYLVAPAIIILANLLFNYIYYGSPLPATGSAKIGQGRSGFWGTGLLFLHAPYMIGFFGSDYRMLSFVLATAVFGLCASWRSITTWLTLAYVVLLGAFYIVLNVPNYHWYYAPFLYFLIVFSAVGVHQLARWVIRLSSNRALSWLFAVPIVLLTLVFGVRSLQLSDVSRGVNEPYRNIGNWIKANTPPKSVVASVEIGTIGWYSDRYIVDILGLTNPYNADFIARKDVHSWLTKYSPNYIVVHQPLWPFEAAATCLTQTGAYAPAPGFHIAGYQLLEKSTVPNVDELINKCGIAGHA